MLADLLFTGQITNARRGVERWSFILNCLIVLIGRKLNRRIGKLLMFLVLDRRMLSSGSLDAHGHNLNLRDWFLLDPCVLLLAHEMNMSLGISSDQLSCMGTRQTGHSNLVCIHWNMHR